MKINQPTIEQQRLGVQRHGKKNWRLWGPYLAECAWGTVREDYSPDGKAWESFTHDQSRSRAYRWSEDGLGGICDNEQRLCFALALWNGCDPILKERAFGLTGNEGNHGEDVKEAYAKSSPETLVCRICISNRGPQAASLHLLPTLWFRNTWSWSYGAQRPQLISGDPTEGVAWSVEGYCAGLGTYRLYGLKPAQLLFTENDSNSEKLWGQANKSPYVKDAFHRFIVDGEQQAVNSVKQGSKSAAWHQFVIESGAEEIIDLVLTNEQTVLTQASCEAILKQRQQEVDQFYQSLLPEQTLPEDQRIFRQALAGMIWNKQFYHLDVARWQDGDKIAPPKTRLGLRNI